MFLEKPSPFMDKCSITSVEHLKELSSSLIKLGDQELISTYRKLISFLENIGVESLEFGSASNFFSSF